MLLNIPHGEKQQSMNCREGGKNTQNEPDCLWLLETPQSLKLLPRGGCEVMTVDLYVLCSAVNIKPLPVEPHT